MANIKVSEMTEATSFDDGDYTMIVQANQNKKISKENILGNIEDDISTINTNISTINTNIGNLSNLETEDKTSIVNSINELENKNNIKNTYAFVSYVGAAISGSDNAFNGFNTFDSHGNLTTSSGGVTIGSGISVILVSASVLLQNATNSYNAIRAGILKNGETILALFSELRNSNGVQGSITLPTIAIPVQEGDVIAIYGNGNQTTSIRRAYLNVKAIF